MKVIVTQTDLEKMIRGKFAADVTDLVVVFEGTPSLIQGNYVESIHRVMYEFPRHTIDQKISAIKRLRELVPGMGLAEAKMAMENTNAAIAFFIRNGSFYK